MSIGDEDPKAGKPDSGGRTAARQEAGPANGGPADAGKTEDAGGPIGVARSGGPAAGAPAAGNATSTDPDAKQAGAKDTGAKDAAADAAKSAPRGARQRRAVRPPTIAGQARDISGPRAEADTGPAKTEPETSPAKGTGPGTPSQAKSGAAGTPPADGPKTAAKTPKSSGGTAPMADTPGTADKTSEAGGKAASGKTTPPEPGKGEPGKAGTGGPAGSGPAGSVSAGSGSAGSQSRTAAADRGKSSAADVGGGGTPIPTARRASLIGAGLVGALIALGIYLGLYYGGILPRDQNTMMDSLLLQSQELGRRIATLESSAARDARRDLGKEVTQLQSAVEELGADPKNSLIRRVRGIESTVENLAGAGEDGSGVAGLDLRLSALENTLSGAGAAVSGDAQTQIADLAKRIEALERPAAPGSDDSGSGGTGSGGTGSGGAQGGTSAPVAALADHIAALDKQMQTLSRQVEGLAGATAQQEAVAKLQTELTAVRGELDTLDASLGKSAASVDDKLAAFQKSMTERDNDAVREAARTTAGALALTSLSKAVDSGAPYAAELDALQPLAGRNAGLLGPLQDHAAAGVADLQTLTERFRAASDEILTASDGSQGGVVDSLLSSARSLVRVRPSGQVAGDSRGAIVARIETALQAGDLQAAQSDWSSLDAAAQQASKSWADALAARITVNEALGKLSAAFAASLTGDAPAQPDGNRAGDTNAGDTNAGDTNAGSTGAGKPAAKPSTTPEPATN